MGDKSQVWKQYEWIAGGNPHVKHRRKIDAGGYGEVHELIDVSSSKPFARKLLRPFGALTDEDLQNELRALDKICTKNHRNIVSVLRHDHLPTSTYYYIDMQLCDINLDDYIYKSWPSELCAKSKFFVPDKPTIPVEWAILGDLVSGLAFIHSLGEVHRDLKPRNVLYRWEDDAWKVADFGATAEGTSKGKFTTVYSRGTPSYRAPELLTDTPFYNAKSDIWAVGCIFYELAAKRKAFNGDLGVERYALSPTIFSIPETQFDWRIQDGAGRKDMDRLIARMLQIECQTRPSAVDLQGEASNRSVHSGGRARTTLLSTLRTEEVDMALVSSEGLIISHTFGGKKVMLWDGTVGGGLISEINTDHGLHSHLALFAVSLNRKYYLALVSASSAIRVGKIGRDGLVEGRPNIVGGDVLCVAISDDCCIALGKRYGIRVYSYTSSDYTSYDSEAKLENEKIDYWNPSITPVRIEINGNFLYAEYYSPRKYVVWNWRESLVVHKFQPADIPDVDGQQYYKLSDLLNARTLVTWDLFGVKLPGMRYSEEVLSVPKRSPLKLSHLSAFGNFLVTCDVISGGLGPRTYQVMWIEIWEVPSGKVLATIKETFDDEGVPTGLSLSPSGNYLAVLFGSTRTIQTWKIQYP